MSLFIAFEGGEGAGKTTQIRRLAERLERGGHAVTATREPGGTPGAEAVRALIVEGAAERWTAETEALLIAAARADHVARCIRPALAAGRVVLCDRFVHSTLAYQGGGNGLDQGLLRGLHDFAAGGLWPDLVLWLDVAPDVGLARAAARRATCGQPAHDRFEDRGRAFHQRVRDTFAALAAADPRIHRLDGAADPEAVAAAVAAVVCGRLGG